MTCLATWAIVGGEVSFVAFRLWPFRTRVGGHTAITESLVTVLAGPYRALLTSGVVIGANVTIQYSPS